MQNLKKCDKIIFVQNATVAYTNAINKYGSTKTRFVVFKKKLHFVYDALKSMFIIIYSGIG